jgi:pilus assembly protein FimV
VVQVIKPVVFLRLALAAVFATLPMIAQAAGLGRLSVQSFLGQPLRAEIEIVALQPGEEASLEARLASGNAFAQAGIEFSPALVGMQFAIQKRSGRPYLQVTTRQPVNEPFLDMLVELRWESGLLVREYTVLLDPPEYRAPKVAAAPQVPAPVAASRAPGEPAPSAMAKPAPALPEPSVVSAPVRSAVPAVPAPAATEAPTTPIAEAARPAPAIEERPITPAPAPLEEKPMAQTVEVRKGDTLGAIARQYRPDGVTFNQMLIALQRANEDAFIRNNVNLVRAGRILNIPEADAIAAVDVADANRLVAAQHSDFAEYSGRLAAAVAKAPAAGEPAASSAAGPITPKAAEPTPAEAKDQLRLSKADAKKPGAPAARAAREDDLAARERALQEAQSRVSDLEKNVSDLQKLLEMRNQQLAELEKKAAAKPAPQPAPTVAAKAPEPPKAAPAPQAAKAPEASPAAQPPAAPAAEPAKPIAEAPKPSPAAPPAGAAPRPAAAKPRPKPVPAPPPPESGLLDEVLDNPLVAFGGLGAVILLLAGYGAWAWKRKKQAAVGGKFQDSVLGPASAAPAMMGGAAAAAPAGAPSVSQSSVSQSAVGGLDTDDVDPIAEADVYMAYGRDAQAEEILKEALQKDGNRVAVHMKLLEIYANRRDARSFEQSATKLRSLTGGAGADWEKAAGLGRSIDPGNSLYGGSGAVAPLIAAPAPAAAAPTVDFDIGGGGGTPSTPVPALDLDLGGASVPGKEKSDFAPGGTLIIDSEETKAASGGLDFDLGGAAEAPAETGGGLDFELPGPTAVPAPAPAAAEAPAASGGLDFDLNLGGGESTGEAPTAAPALDLSAINLDLGTPAEAQAAPASADPKWQEVATKLDLAKAYEEMGDKDGARELLNEVLREGDSAQQGQATQLLGRLG